jgi:SAM-dependent methyltransferase
MTVAVDQTTVRTTTAAPEAPALRHCIVCGGAELSLVFEVGRELDGQGLIPTTDAFGTALDDIMACGDCGHRQLAHMPTEVELLKLYVSARADHYIEEEAGQRRTARAALRHIERHVQRGRLLDLGCWIGYLLHEARRAGWDVTGVEPSDFAASFAREELGLPIVNADMMSAELPLGSFDAIVLGDVLEHLTDPGAALDRIASLLAPGGVVYMTIPDAGSRLARAMGSRWWSVIPTHVQYFSRDSVRSLLVRHGFKTLEIKTAPKTFTVRYYLSRIAGYSPGVADRLVRHAERLRLADRLWTPDFRDRMGVVARLRR